MIIFFNDYNYQNYSPSWISCLDERMSPWMDNFAMDLCAFPGSHILSGTSTTQSATVIKGIQFCGTLKSLRIRIAQKRRMGSGRFHANLKRPAICDGTLWSVAFYGKIELGDQGSSCGLWKIIDLS